jgi:hypothetical protein
MNAAEQRALLELFADIDTTFNEGDAFTNPTVSLGRCY